MPGEVAQVVKTTDGCCDKYEVVCKPETCAVQPPTCSSPQVMRNSNPGACCPTFKCGKWLVQGIWCHSLKVETELNINISQILISWTPCTTSKSCTESPEGRQYGLSPSTVYSLNMLSSMYWFLKYLNVFSWSVEFKITKYKVTLLYLCCKFSYFGYLLQVPSQTSQ